MVYVEHSISGPNRSNTQLLGPRFLAARDAHDRLGGIVLAVATMMNFLLAVLNAHGVEMNTATVTVVQILITAVAASLVYFRTPKFTSGFIWSLFAIVVFSLLTSVAQGFNAKCFYDMMLIPIFILVGSTLERFPLKIFNQLVGVVLITALLEIFLPSVYIAIANPLNYLINTRAWIADAASSLGASEGLYVGALRAGGSQFSLADHRVGSVFLEPVSLGYFALIASFVYIEIYKNRMKRRLIAIAVCLFLSLAADSRIPTMLIIVSTFGVVVMPRVPKAMIVFVPSLIFAVAAALYVSNASFLYGDMGYRLAITFDGLTDTDVPTMILGGVPESRIGDSGALYMVRCLGLIGAPFALLVFAGCFSRHKASPAFINVAAAGYLTVGALFGGAIFSIKTAALLGIVVGYAGSHTFALPPLAKSIRRHSAVRVFQG